MGKLRGVIDQIEAALVAGVSRTLVYECLKENLGLEMKMESFIKSLQRLRKERRKSENHTVVVKLATNLSNQQSISPVPITPETDYGDDDENGGGTADVAMQSQINVSKNFAKQFFDDNNWALKALQEEKLRKEQE